jgi:hypothetical protein
VSARIVLDWLCNLPLGHVLVLDGGKKVIKCRQVSFGKSRTGKYGGCIFRRTRWTDNIDPKNTEGTRTYTDKQLEHARILDAYQTEYKGIT